MTRVKRCAGGLLLLAVAAVAHGSDLLMVRSPQTFPEAMLTLQTSIREHGYVVSRVQRVDIGLTRMGFKTDKYRVVFFGKPDEVRALSRSHPELIPYLPLKMAVFAEGNQTLVVVASTARLQAFFAAPDLTEVFERWERDLESILDDMREAE